MKSPSTEDGAGLSATLHLLSCSQLTLTPSHSNSHTPAPLPPRYTLVWSKRVFSCSSWGFQLRGGCVCVCAGERGLPCLFRKWLRTGGIWRSSRVSSTDSWGSWGGGWMWWGERCVGTTETPRAQEGVGGCIHFVGQDQTLTQSGWEPGEREEERSGSQGQPEGRENVCPFLLAGVATSHQHMVGLGLFWGCASVWVWLDDESI